MKGVSEMIEEIIALLRAQGIDIPTPVRNEVEAAFRYEHAGERVYVKGLPKQQRAVQLARLELKNTRELSIASGMNVRTVRRIMRGR